MAGPPKDGEKPSFPTEESRRLLLHHPGHPACRFLTAGRDQAVPYDIHQLRRKPSRSSEIDPGSLLRNGIAAQTRIPYFDESLLPTLKEKGVSVTGTVAEISILQVVLQLLPWIIFIGFTIMLYRQSSGLNGRMMSTLGKSRAKEYMETDTKITFADVAGQVEQRACRGVVFLKRPTTV